MNPLPEAAESERKRRPLISPAMWQMLAIFAAAPIGFVVGAAIVVMWIRL